MDSTTFLSKPRDCRPSISEISLNALQRKEARGLEMSSGKRKFS